MRALDADADGNVVVCQDGEMADGDRRVFRVGRRRVGVFRIEGRYVALHGGCPHAGGALCEGPLTGTTLPGEPYTYEYGREGRVLRCAWHGIEFDVETGASLVDPKMRARTYPVVVDGGAVVVNVRGRTREAS